jgi:hypothetical protein
LREYLVLGDPLGRQFRVDVLRAAGLGQTPSPGLLDPALLTLWRTALFESFWARFGSLGAGPFPGSRLWTLYGLTTAGMLIAFAAGLVEAFRSPRRGGVLIALATGAIAAVALWFYVSLVPRPYMAIHWTPRYVQPALPLIIAVTAAGVRRLVAMVGVPDGLVNAAGAAMILVAATAAISVLRATILMVHFGY